MLRLPLVGQELLLLTFTEELLLLGLLTGSLGLGEVGVVDGLGNGDTGQVNLGGGGDNVGLGNSSQGDTVESERTRDEQETGIELLQEDDSLSSESTGQEDEDGTGGDGGSELGLADSLSAGLGLGDILALHRGLARTPTSSSAFRTHGVELGSLVSGESPRALGTDLLFNRGGLLDLLGGGAGLLSLEVTSLGEDRGSRVSTDVGSKFRVSGHLWEGEVSTICFPIILLPTASASCVPRRRVPLPPSIHSISYCSSFCLITGPEVDVDCVFSAVRDDPCFVVLPILSSLSLHNLHILSRVSIRPQPTLTFALLERNSDVDLKGWSG